MKKQITAILTAAAMFTAAGSLTAFADETESVDITVSLSAYGEQQVVSEPLTVTDQDEDGALTINDALILAHDAYYEGGAEAGYSSDEVTWNGNTTFSILMLWGDTSGSFGYTVNDVFAWSPKDTLSDGDALYAYVYEDVAYFTDQYSYFDKRTEDGLTQGDTLTLTLNAIGYDADWNQVTQPVENAVITVNGERTEYTTDAEGNVTITLDVSGDVIISAVSDDVILVPPIFRADVTAAETTETTAETTETTTSATSAESTSEATSASSSETTAATTAATTTAAAPKTGESAATALCVTGLLAAAAAFALRRHDA